ncbi:MULTISPECIES: DUF3800 domain-containing protein [Mycobacterium]|uniref:DUF3800 domain-containing protein n=1 Tax=Mycobacterium TaxID=1763 RepID=UPI0005B4459A|nr:MULTISPECIES: DUF3800 domain-containing protein [Mycobacterium]UQB90879.1 DUF3800 domain-containing protein [Mycobacterium intracellulare]WSE48430.1 DUF3800 domain-containing protein [Mycobacterium sp. 3-98]
MRLYYFDDAGDRSGRPDKPPFFTLGGFGIDADQLPLLKGSIQTTAFNLGFNSTYPSELKFSHVGLNRDPDRKPNWMIRSGLTTQVEKRALVIGCLQTLAAIPSVKIIVVGVNQRLTYGGQSPIIHGIHPLFERINYDCREHATGGLVICDEEQADDKRLRDATRSGSFYTRFDKLVDAISFMPSHESIGVQMADLIAGGFNRYLNSEDPGYVRILWPKLRANGAGRVHGFGVKLFPSGTCPNPPDPPWPLPGLDEQVGQRLLQCLGR